MGCTKKLLVMVLALVLVVPAGAQMVMPSSGATAFKDTSAFKPPSGAKVAIIEFEDLECPLCAQVSPIVQEAMSRYHIPRVHHDFIIQGHMWSRNAAIYARYLEDKVSLQVAEDFRRDVFASQRLIASPDDLQQFTRRWFQAHGQAMPFCRRSDGQMRRGGRGGLRAGETDRGGSYTDSRGGDCASLDRGDGGEPVVRGD